MLARIPEGELISLLEGYGWRPIIVAGDEPMRVHQAFAAALDEALDEIGEIQRAAREDGVTGRPQWPLLVLRTPKGWTGPKGSDGLPVEGTWRAHQVPVTMSGTTPITCASWRTGCAAIARRSSSTTRVGRFGARRGFLREAKDA